MTAIPSLKIPITVITDQVAPALRKVERDVRSSTERMARAKSMMMPALRGMGAAGGMGMFGGMGPAGIGIGIAMAPMLAASQWVETFAEQTKGAGAALAQFREGAGQVFAANSVILKRLAEREPSAQAAMGTSLKQAFVGAYGGTAQNGLGATFESWDRGITQVAGFLGALTAGKSVKTAGLEAELSTASEPAALKIKEEIDAQRRREAAGEEQGMLGVAVLTEAIRRLSDLVGDVGRKL